jgi:tetratricopeptide (TPR) repeat protein
MKAGQCRIGHFFRSALALLSLSLSGVVAMAQPSALHPIPDPDLGDFEPAVRNALQSAADRVRENVAVRDGPDGGSDFGRLGMLYQAHDLRIPAAQCYDNAILLQPGEARWRYYRAFLHQEEGEIESAIVGFRRVTELDPGYFPAAVRLGRLYLQTGDNEQAARWFQTALETEPDEAAAIAGLGQAEVQLKRYEQAVTHLEAALQREPAASQLRYPLALAYRETGATDKAREQLQLRGKGQVSLADEWLGQMHSLSLSSDYYVRAAIYELNRKETEAAAKRAAYAVRLNPENVGARVLYGGVLDSLGEPDAAMEQIDAALAIEPDNWQANFNKAVLLEKSGDEPGARDYFRKTLVSRTDHTRSRRLLANSLMRAGDYQSAATEFRALREILPEESQLYFWEGLALVGAGDCAAAREIMEEGWNANPSSPVLAQGVLRILATCSRPDAARLEEAVQIADRLARQQPSVSHLETVAMVVAAMGRYAAAVDVQTQAIFEAAKGGDLERYPGLSVNVQRYQQSQPAQEPWQPDDPIFSPPPLKAGEQ